MKTFYVEVPFSGYSSGYDYYTVEAETPEEAMAKFKEDHYEFPFTRNTARDDTESCWSEATVEGYDA